MGNNLFYFFIEKKKSSLAGFMGYNLNFINDVKSIKENDNLFL